MGILLASKRMQFVKENARPLKVNIKKKILKRLRLILEEVHTTVAMEQIIPELILNWDQTAIKIVPSSQWTM